MLDSVSRKIILLAEDNQEMRDMARLALESAGYIVLTVQAGPQSLIYADLSPPDLILLDIKLEGSMDGLGVLTQLKADEKMAGIPVMILTADARQVQKDRARDLGAEYYMTKPYHVNDLIMNIQRILTGHAIGGGIALSPVR